MQQWRTAWVQLETCTTCRSASPCQSLAPRSSHPDRKSARCNTHGGVNKKKTLKKRSLRSPPVDCEVSRSGVSGGPAASGLIASTWPHYAALRHALWGVGPALTWRPVACDCPKAAGPRFKSDLGAYPSLYCFPLSCHSKERHVPKTEDCPHALTCTPVTEKLTEIQITVKEPEASTA